MPVHNPRFPHYCRIIRKWNDEPLEEEEDFTPIPPRPMADNSDYDPLGDDMESSGESGNTGQSNAQVPDGESGIQVIVYEGPCRSYAKNTTSDKGEVITSYRGLALPVTEDEWSEREYVPQEGDEVAVSHSSYTEYGRVIDRNPANFHGTHLTWRYGRN